MNNKFFFLYFFLILSSNQILAQVFHSLQENTKLLLSQDRTRNIKKHQIDTINIPFFEDFSEPEIYPNQKRWADNYVYINRSFAYNPPSIGVATFDIISFDGKIYPTVGTTTSLADKLTSLPIDLSPYTKADSIYFSFFYQPQGLGWDMPDKADSLVLKFKNKEGKWVSVWNVSGSALKPFKQVILPIHNPEYLYRGFQFMFANYASLGDPQQQEDAIKNDFWNIDFIVIDTNRTMVDTTYQDISFFESKEFLFYKYKAIPYNHFKLSQLQKDTMNYHIRNLDKEINSIDNMRFELNINHNSTDYFSLGTMNIGASKTVSKDFSYNQMISSPGNSSSQIPHILKDSTTFEIVQYFDAHATAKPCFSANDTLKFQMNCFNYYAFDDGSSELGLTLIENDTKLAYKIEALKADTLRGISILFNRYKDFGTSEEAIFNLCVWENNAGLPGKLIYKEENTKTKYAWGIDHFSYFKLQEAVYVDSTFFVGFETTNGKLYSLAYDINNHNEGQTYFWKNNWSEISIGTPMIRTHHGDDFSYINVDNMERPQITFNIFPNPTQNKIHISIIEKNNRNESYTIQAFNLQGKLIYQSTFEQQKFELSTQKWHKGVYLIRIKNDKEIGFCKLIKY